MTDQPESRDTPQPSTCQHKWQAVEGADCKDGERVVMCAKCNQHKTLQPAMQEGRSDRPPLLTE